MVAMEGNGGADKITIGVCVMEKKVFSSPMEKILERLRAFGEFEVRKILPFAPSTVHFPILFHQFAKSGGECKIEVCLWDE